MTSSDILTNDLKRTKQKKLNLFQMTYEVLCFAGVFVIEFFLKEGVGKLVPFLFVPFLFVYIQKNVSFRKIAFAIILAALAYCMWTVIITFYLTSYLYKKSFITEHSLWDIFAFLIPAVLTVWTLIWSIKRRVEKPRFEIGFLTYLILALLILTNCR